MGCSSTWTHRWVLQTAQSPIYYVPGFIITSLSEKFSGLIIIFLNLIFEYSLWLLFIVLIVFSMRDSETLHPNITSLIVCGLNLMSSNEDLFSVFRIARISSSYFHVRDFVVSQ